MDFENMKRKQLQALCKEHGIPANLTNLEMASKLSSLLKVNDEKPLTRGRSCLKVLDENGNDREFDVVNRKVKKVKFSPDNEIIEFTRSARVGRGARGKTRSYKNNLNVESDGLKVGILDSPVRVTRSQRVNTEVTVTEKKGRTRHVKDSVISVNESKDEVGVTTKRTLKNKEVVIIQEKRKENEGVDDGLRMNKRVKSKKNAKESIEDSQEELKINGSEKEVDRTHKRDKKVTFISGGQMDECTKSEIKAEETKRVTRRKSMAHNQKLPVEIEVDAAVREEVAEKPARVTRSQNLKLVEDNVSNKRNRAGKEAIQKNEEQLCTEFIEPSVEAVKDEVTVNTRWSQQNSVSEAPEKALKRSGRVANKEKGARLSDDVTNKKMATRGRTRNQSNLTVEASTSESVESKGKHEVVLQCKEPVEVPLRRSDRRKSVVPSLEKVRSDEVEVIKEKRNLNANDGEIGSKETKEEPHKASKQSKRLATQVENSVLAKGVTAENKIDRPTESQGTLEVVPQTGEVPLRSNRRKSVVPSLEKVRSDEVEVVKEKRNLNANDGEIRTKGTNEEPQKASKRSKRLAKQMHDPILSDRGIAENKLEERRSSRRNAANANVDTKILDSSVQEETSVVKEERRCSGRSAARHTVAAVSDDMNEKGENKLTKRNYTAIQEKDSTKKLTLQDLGSPKQSMSSSKASVKASAVKKTSTSRKKQQGRLKRSDVDMEVPMPEDMEIVREPDNKDCNISGSGGTMSFSRSSLNDLEAVPDDVNIVLPGTKDDVAAESSTVADKLIEEGPVVDANSSPPEDNSALKSLPLSDPFNSDARPEENFVEELLKSHQDEPASKGLCPSPVLADDAHPNDLTSYKQEPGAIAADNAEEFVAGLSNDVIDNCSLSQIGHMGENLDSGTKDDAAAESSTLADKLIEEGPLVEANASPSENNSTFDPFNSNPRPKENLDEELWQFDHEAPAGKDLCPSPALDEDAVANEITTDKQEHGSIAADNAEGISDKVLDDCSLSQSDNMEENPDSGFNEESEAVCVTEGVIYGEQESASKILCPSFSLAADAIPNDTSSDKQEDGSVMSDYEEVDTGLSNEVLDNMEENLDADLKEQAESGCIVKEGVTYGEQEPESKGLCPSSVLADDAVPSSVLADDAVPSDISEKVEHGAIAADNAKEFDSGSSNEVLDNCSVNNSDNIEEKLDSGFKEQTESQCIDSGSVNYGEEEVTVTDYGKEFDVGLSSNVSLDNVGPFNQSNEMEVKISEADIESGHMEQTEADPVEAKYDLDAPTFTSQGEKHAEECANLEASASEKTVSSPIKTVLDLHEPVIFSDGIALHVTPSEVTPSEDSDEEKQDEELKILFATPCYVSHSIEEKKASLDGDLRNEDLNRERQVSRSRGKDTSSLQSSAHDCGEHGQEPVILGDGIALNVTPSEDSDEEKQGEELKILFATPRYVSHSKEEKKASLDGDLRNEDLNREGQVSPSSGNDTPSLQSSVRDCGEHGEVAEPVILGDGITLNVTPSEDSDEEKQGEELKILFATPRYVSHSKEEKKASLDGDLRNGDLNREGQVSPSSGNDTSSLQSSVRDCGEHGEGEYLKSLFVTPLGSRSRKVITTGTAINETSSQYKYSCHENENTASSAGNDNGFVKLHKARLTLQLDAVGKDLKGLFATPSVISQSVGRSRDGLGGGVIENKQVEEDIRTSFASPVSVECTNHETTSSKGKWSQSREMKTYICSEAERNFGEFEAVSVEVDQAPETSHITAFYNGDENEQENQLHMLFASPINTQSLDQMDGTSRKTGNKCFLFGNVQELSHNKVFPVAYPNAMDLEEPESIDTTYSEEQIKFEKTKETSECMKEFSALEEKNNEGQGNTLTATAAKSMTPLQNDEFSSQESNIKETAECMKESSALGEENIDGQGNTLSATSAKNMTPLQNEEFSSQEMKIAGVAMSGEMVRDTEMHTSHESCVVEICDTEEHKIEETVADRDLLLKRGISRGLEDVYVGITNKSTSPVISEPTCDDIGFSEQQMMPEINKNSLENVKTSDAFNEGSEDHLKLLFATPIKATSPSRVGEASSCQLKTAAIAMDSEMADKQLKQGFEFSGELLTVGISGGSGSTKRSCWSKEIEQFEGGPLFLKPSKGPLELEKSLGCEEDVLSHLDDVREQKSAQHGDPELLNEMTDDAGEVTLDWFQTNNVNVPTQIELETQNDNNSALPFEPLHEEGEVREDDALAEGNEDDHLVVYQESLEDGLINTYEAAKGGAVSDAVCHQPNIPLNDIEIENITQESTRKSDGISVSAESGILELDAESTALRSQETIIITVEETKEDEVQKLEVKNISNAFLQNIPNDGEYVKHSSTVLPADEQFHFPEHYEVENDSSTEFTASPNDCQHVSKDLAAEEDRVVIIESNESMSMNVDDSGLITQMDLPGIFAGESSNKAHSALSEELQSGSDLGRFSAAKQQDEYSFDKKEHVSTEAVLSPSSKSRENISCIKEGTAGEGTLMFEKKDEVPLTPAASVAKTSFAKHFNSTVKKKNARSILIHGTPNKLTQIADMKENAPSVKGDIGTLTALRPEKRPALKDLPRK